MIGSGKSSVLYGQYHAKDGGIWLVAAWKPIVANFPSLPPIESESEGSANETLD